MRRHSFRYPFLFLFPILATLGCDPLRKSKCEWYLIPHEEGIEVAKEGQSAVCVVNYELGRRRCYFNISPELANQFSGVPFRYDQMDFDDATFPRKIFRLVRCGGG